MVAPPVAHVTGVPELPEQCSSCSRWVDRYRLAVVPVGADTLCFLCCAVADVAAVIGSCELSRVQEEDAIATLRDAYNIIRGRG